MGKREIKFRAWNKTEQIYYYGIGLDSNDSCPRCIDISEPLRQVTFDDVIIEQFTGLKDKNGVEIYEGDIVHLTSFNPANYEV